MKNGRELTDMYDEMKYFADRARDLVSLFAGYMMPEDDKMPEPDTAEARAEIYAGFSRIYGGRVAIYAAEDFLRKLSDKIEEFGAKLYKASAEQ